MELSERVGSTVLFYHFSDLTVPGYSVLRTTQTPFKELETFVVPYTVSRPSASESEEAIDLENPRPSATAELPCALAIELLADINLEKAANGDESAADCLKKADEVCRALSTPYLTHAGLATVVRIVGW